MVSFEYISPFIDLKLVPHTPGQHVHWTVLEMAKEMISRCNNFKVKMLIIKKTCKEDHFRKTLKFLIKSVHPNQCLHT